MRGIVDKFGNITITVDFQEKLEGPQYLQQGGKTIWLPCIAGCGTVDLVPYNTATHTCKKCSEDDGTIEYEVWDQEYHHCDTPEVIFGGSRKECCEFLKKRNNPFRYFLAQGLIKR